MKVANEEWFTDPVLYEKLLTAVRYHATRMPGWKGDKHALLSFDDYVAAGLERVWKQRDKYSPYGGASFATWAGHVAANSMLTYYQTIMGNSFTDRDRGGTNPRGRLEANKQSFDADLHDQGVEDDYTYMFVADQLDTLTPRQREIVDLLLEGYSQVEVADMLGISPPAIWHALQWGSKKMGIERKKNPKKVAAGKHVQSPLRRQERRIAEAVMSGSVRDNRGSLYGQVGLLDYHNRESLPA